MAKNETMYDVIFPVYELDKDSKQEKEKYRKLLRGRFEKKFPRKGWDNISQAEKDVFVFVDIREDMFNYYVTDPAIQKRVLQRIDEKLKTMFSQTMSVKHNRRVDIEFRTDYYKPKDSDTPKRKAYAEFCKDLSNVNRHVPIPEYNEWVQWNERAIKGSGTPLTIHDCVMSFYDSLDSEYARVKNAVSQSEIDHVVLEILKGKFEKELGFEINIPKIKECLTYIKNHAFEESEYVPTEVDSALGGGKNASLEEQQKEMEENARYIMYKEMWDNLDFVTEKETGDRK